MIVQKKLCSGFLACEKPKSVFQLGPITVDIDETVEGSHIQSFPADHTDPDSIDLRVALRSFGNSGDPASTVTEVLDYKTSQYLLRTRFQEGDLGLFFAFRVYEIDRTGCRVVKDTPVKIGALRLQYEFWITQVTIRQGTYDQSALSP
jgi:hypothetical protein